jgi:hypothetical protein
VTTWQPLFANVGTIFADKGRSLGRYSLLTGSYHGDHMPVRYLRVLRSKATVLSNGEPGVERQVRNAIHWRHTPTPPYIFIARYLINLSAMTTLLFFLKLEYLDVTVLRRGIGEVRGELQHADKDGETSARTESKRMTNGNTPQLSRMDLANHCAAFPGLSLLITRAVQGRMLL